MNDTIHVALASDDNYFDGLLVTAWSIAKFCNQDRKVVIHILDGGISDAHWSFLEESIRNFNTALDRVAINQETTLCKFGNWHGSSKMAYSRLLLPDLLPNVEHVIYSDVDFVWLGDISKLWNLRDQSLILQYVPEHTEGRDVGQEEMKWVTDRGFKLTPGKYFCTGMLLMNLAAFRKESLHLKIIKFLIDNGGSAPFADQTVLNIAMDKRTDTGELPQNWQVETGNPNGCCENNDLAIHYPSDAPWKSIQLANHLLTEPHILWHSIYAHIYGITMWQSLRKCNSATGIILSRTLYLLTSNCPWFRAFIRAFLRITGRKSSISYVEPYMHKIKFARFPQLG